MIRTARPRRTVGVAVATLAATGLVVALVTSSLGLVGGTGAGGPDDTTSPGGGGGWVTGSGAPATATAWSPDRAVLPADLPPPPSEPALPAACRAARPTGWLRAEDARVGAAGFRVPPDAGPGHDVLGYADRGSARCGDTVQVALAGPAQRIRLAAYRLGAYRGAAARLVWEAPDVAVGPRPVSGPAPRAGTGLIEPRWPTSVVVPVTADWPPGVYLLVPTAVDFAPLRPAPGAAGVAAGPVGPAIPLVVRDDAGREPVLFVASTLTWNAYDDWRGYSMYRGPGTTAAARYAARVRVASFRRPLVGAGYRQLVFMDLPVVEQLERTGLDAACTTDVDVDQRPSQLVGRAELVFGGHSEYWTRRAYDAVAAVRARGTNLLFLGANNLWWHARLETGPGAVVPDREVVEREVRGDPTPADRPGDRTLLWSAWPEHRDPAAMLGAGHAGIAVHGGYQVLAAPAWMLAGTGLLAAHGDRLGSVLPGAVGNEADGYLAGSHAPPGVDVVAAGVLRGAHGPVVVSADYLVAPSGAAVFEAGTTDWACALRRECFDQHVPAPTATALARWTTDLLVTFATPRAGRTHPATASVPSGAATLAGLLDPQALGVYGGSEASQENAAARSASVAGVAPGRPATPGQAVQPPGGGPPTSVAGPVG